MRLREENPLATILILDDYAPHCDLLARWLTYWRYSVAVAATGPAGLAYALAQQPDVILLDLRLPEMDGLEVTRRLKAHPATAHIGVIALTAFAPSGTREQCLAAGCDDFETKPVDFDRLRAKIQVLVVGRPASSPPATRPAASGPEPAPLRRHSLL